ncbi:GDSL-type esterase/lipase family protein [Kocuria flava]|uniref:GDSL-type esterase/lipase family protein n=1 Tax=Kocuria flava TaxID=446860 RepID=UPI001FF364DD|nr:GDSL-type esterase/lipase family protein [Kocuria flava]MCJ8506221.1 GDSL-type esterase/lipase family protein [Kocuria flava]
MPPIPTRRAAAVLGTALALTGLGVPSAAAAPPTLDVVNLGDSYSAGIGTGGVRAQPWDERCLQGSGRDHVAALDDHPRVDVVLDAACAGFRSADVAALAGTPAVAAALAGADAVTLTLGGNDVGWGEFVTRCGTRGDPEACEELQDEAPARIAAAAEAAGRTIAAVDDATCGQVVVLGYPRLFDARRDSALITAERAAELNAWTDELNAALEEAVTAEGAGFVDVTDRFRGHGVGARDPWILFEPGGQENLHPTERGYLSGYLPALRGELARAR